MRSAATDGSAEVATLAPEFTALRAPLAGKLHDASPAAAVGFARDAILEARTAAAASKVLEPREAAELHAVTESVIRSLDLLPAVEAHTVVMAKPHATGPPWRRAWTSSAVRLAVALVLGIVVAGLVLYLVEPGPAVVLFATVLTVLAAAVARAVVQEVAADEGQEPPPQVSTQLIVRPAAILDVVEDVLSRLDALRHHQERVERARRTLEGPELELFQDLVGAHLAADQGLASASAGRVPALLARHGIEVLPWSAERDDLFDPVPAPTWPVVQPTVRPALRTRDGQVLARGEVLVDAGPTPPPVPQPSAATPPAPRGSPPVDDVPGEPVPPAATARSRSDDEGAVFDV